MLAADRADLAGVFHGDGLSTSGVVGDGKHNQRNAFTTYAGDQRFEGFDVHIALEGMHERRVLALFAQEVDGLGAGELDIGAGGIEMGVVGHDVAGLAHHTEEDAFGGATLVGGDDVLISHDFLHGIAEAVEAGAAGIAFVAAHDGRPLRGGHGASAGVGEEIDEDFVGVEEKDVVGGLAE